MAAPLVCIALASAFLSAQTTWVVDQGGGPGSHFTEIQPAIDAASPGDRIEVGPGSYQPFTMSKGLDLDATVGGVIVAGDVTIQGIPFWQQTVVEGIATRTLTVVDCTGPVHLRSVNATGSWGSLAACVIRRSPSVFLEGCEFVGAGSLPFFSVFGEATGGLWVENSSVYIQGSTLKGGDGSVPGQDGEGMNVVDARVVAAASTFRGGFGYVEPVGSPWDCGRTYPGAPGISGSGSLLLMAGCDVIGGPGGSGSGFCSGGSPRGAAIAADGVRITSDCQLTGSGGPSTSIPKIPFMSLSRTVRRGQRFTAELTGEPGTMFMVYADVRHGYTPLAGLEIPVFLTAKAFQLTTVYTGTDSIVAWNAVVPDLPVFQDLVVYSQAIALELGPLKVSVTNMAAIRTR